MLGRELQATYWIPGKCGVRLVFEMVSGSSEKRRIFLGRQGSPKTFSSSMGALGS